MRDPKRIEPMIAVLRAVWKTNPDLRLGQIIVNACKSGEDPFYVEDGEMQKRLYRLLASTEPGAAKEATDE